MQTIRHTVPAMVSGRVPAGTTSLFYIESGEGPAVLFLHAGVADSRMWRSQLGAVEGFRTVSFDRRGFGRTTIGAEGYSDENDAVAVMDHLRIDQAVVVGCSMGGAVAFAMARDYPDRVRGLVLVGADAPGFEPESTWESPEWPLALEAFRAGDMMTAARLDAEIWLAGKNRTLDDIDPELVDLFCEMDLIALENETARDDLLALPQVERHPEPAPPSVVIVGAHDLPGLIEAAHHMADALGSGPPAVLEDTAHLPSMDQPDQFNRALSGFLGSL